MRLESPPAALDSQILFQDAAPRLADLRTLRKKVTCLTSVERSPHCARGLIFPGFDRRIFRLRTLLPFPEFVTRMKVLIDHGMPFQLAHGGYQKHIEETKRGLEEAGAQVEWLRWWDDTQRADIILAFAPVTHAVLIFAREKKIPVALHTLLSGLCDLPPWRLRLMAWRELLFSHLPGIRGSFKTLPQEAFRLCAHNLVSLKAEGEALEQVYQIPAGKIFVMPFGVSEPFLNAQPATREADYLICTGTITERKNSVALAQLARQAEVPVLFVGKPYHSSAPYWRQFESLIDDRWVRYRQHVANPDELIGALRSARGFVIMSQIETLCFSAQEAAACGLPLLLPDQKWSHELFGGEAAYFRGANSVENAAILGRFYEGAAAAPAPRIHFITWKEVGEKHLALFEKLLKASTLTS